MHTRTILRWAPFRIKRYNKRQIQLVSLLRVSELQELYLVYVYLGLQVGSVSEHVVYEGDIDILLE